MTQVTHRVRKGAGYVCLRLTENCDIQQKLFFFIARRSLSEASRREVTQDSCQVI
jgi:hypothetical protein